MSTSMDLTDLQAPDVFVACAVCVIEVPLDEAIVPEVIDRLVYLYGFDCYARWRGAAAISYPSLSS